MNVEVPGDPPALGGVRSLSWIHTHTWALGSAASAAQQKPPRLSWGFFFCLVTQRPKPEWDADGFCSLLSCGHFLFAGALYSGFLQDLRFLPLMVGLYCLWEALEQYTPRPNHSSCKLVQARGGTLYQCREPASPCFAECFLPLLGTTPHSALDSIRGWNGGDKHVSATLLLTYITEEFVHI